MTQIDEYRKPVDTGEFSATLPLTPYPSTDGRLPAVHRKIRFEKVESSGPSRLIYGLDEDTGEQLVLKVLAKEPKQPYNLSTYERRQQVQSYAYYQNKRITPDVYQGIVSVGSVLDLTSPGGTIELGSINENPEPENLNKALDYGLLMRRLPDDALLINRLRYGPRSDRLFFVQLVATRIAKMHQEMKSLPDFLEDNTQKWGSCEQLRKKFRDNIQFADQKLMQRPAYQEIAQPLKELLFELFERPFFRERFEQRRRTGCIQSCHGDLKTQNIWITLENPFDKERWKDVKILDAIDFNPVYSNIDILSDFAMLVVDVRVQTDAVIADEMVKMYLEQTHQDNDEARFILNYYLIEKALVCATTRSLKDDLPEPDLAFLDVARGYMNKLRRSTHQFKHKEILSY